ncbi:MAG: hypothetical protein Q9166_005055 [cf. Caloplaca sp. 2 TL-2023]
MHSHDHDQEENSTSGKNLQPFTTEHVDGQAYTVFVSIASWKRSKATWNKRNTLEALSSQWTQRFAQIYNGHTDNVPSSALPTSLVLDILNEDKCNLVQRWEQVITGLPLQKRHLLWEEVMLWALQYRIDKATIFLDATISDPTVAALRHAVEDALKYIVSVSLDGQVASLETINKVHQLLCDFAKASMLREDCTYSISQKTVYLVMRYSNDHQARFLYKVLLHSRLNVHPHSLTHFMDRFTRMGRPDLAMDVLRRIAASGANVSYDTVQYSCMTLLRTRFDEAEWYKVQSHLVTEMLELGIRPGIPMLNAMILNAVEAYDFQTAQAIFETARIHGIRRDTITYSILLKGALQSLDESLIEKIMQMAEEDGTLPRNNELVFSLIVTLLQMARLNDTNIVTSAHRYRVMLRIYSRYCNILPLRELGIDAGRDEDVVTAGIVSEPSPKLLSVMVVSYIRLLGRPDLVKPLYHRYHSYVEENHHVIAPTAETDHLANAFLLCLGRNKTTFKTCPMILRNMLEPSPTISVEVAKPTVKTWSIVASSYFFLGQRAAGEKVIQMMREKGVDPNQVTWNTIISGYAGMQDASGVVNAMKGMESAGFEANSYTLKALARIQDRSQLLDALRRAAVTDDKMEANAQVKSYPSNNTRETPFGKGNDGSSAPGSNGEVSSCWQEPAPIAR